MKLHAKHSLEKLSNAKGFFHTILTALNSLFIAMNADMLSPVSAVDIVREIIQTNPKLRVSIITSPVDIFCQIFLYLYLCPLDSGEARPQRRWHKQTIHVPSSFPKSTDCKYVDENNNFASA
eukprot:TRINITY_DN4992_c0_g1_i1.p2 TRINITY_DN4992_c0_g1~~TRINITY_DN4992_c0_g1_i1.p2  ORF type:complete len:122 (-),score=8.23 TRINITY_DN4992_c0_g1_i1:1388-1753(-)